MFVVLDDKTERRLLGMAGALTDLVSVPLPEFSATLNRAEDLIFLRLEGRSPVNSPEGPSVTFSCYGCLSTVEEHPPYPEAATKDGCPRLLLMISNGATKTTGPGSQTRRLPQ